MYAYMYINKHIYIYIYIARVYGSEEGKQPATDTYLQMIHVYTHIYINNQQLATDTYVQMLYVCTHIHTPIYI